MLPLLLVLATTASAAVPPKIARPPEVDESRWTVSDGHYLQGLDALKKKNGGAAIAALTLCVEADPERLDCLWELGWAYSLKWDWPRVVEAWQSLQAREPGRKDVQENLALARAQLQLREEIARLEAQPPEPRPPPPPGAALRIRAVGDMMIGTDFPEGYLPPEDGARILSGVKALLEDADFTFANLEGPLCDSGTSDKCKSPDSETCYAFRSPTRYGRYYQEVGIDVVSTANNHSGDFGEECRRQTERTLDALGIRWSGPPGSVAYLEKDGVKLAVVAFHTALGCNFMHDYVTAEGLVRTAAAQADVVLVSFHGGAEGAKYQRVPNAREIFHGEDRGHLREFSRRMIDAGGDLVIGHGPHVLRAMEVYKDRLIAYSLGNFATFGRFNLKGPNGLGVVLEVTVDGEGRLLEGRALPTRQVDDGVPVKDPRREAIPLLRTLSQQDFPKTAIRIDDSGRITSRSGPPKGAGRGTRTSKAQQP